MKWNHLPVTGGIYEQDPRLLDDFVILFGMEAKAQEEQQKRREAEASKQKAKAASRSRSRRR